MSTDTKCGRDKPLPFVKRLQCNWGWMWHCPVMLVAALHSSCKFFRGLLAAPADSSVRAAVRSRGVWHSRPQSRWVLTQPHAPGLLLRALGPAGRPPPETTRQPGLAGCMAMQWRAPGILRSQMRRRYEGARRPVQRPPWVIRRASCGVAVQPRCDAGPDRNRAPGPGRARAALRASASNGPREGPSVYCTGALWKALA